MEMTLGKALRYRKRVAEWIARCNRRITEGNRLLVGAEPICNVDEELRRRAVLVQHLVDLKTAIEDANGPVRRLIKEVSELKAEVALLRGLPTQSGASLEGFSETPVEFTVAVGQDEADRRIDDLESEIDLAHEKLDTFNATTTIIIPDLRVNDP